MKFNLGCQLHYSISQPTTFIFNIGVVRNECQQILRENFYLDPAIALEEGNTAQLGNRYIRLSAPVGSLEIAYRATVELSPIYANPDEISEVALSELPLEILTYLFPSRYCQSDRLIRLAECQFGHLPRGYARVAGICDWIHDNVAYLFGTTNPHTSAYDTATERAGVCRDFAHLGIAFCRALDIPARFVSAYAYGLNPPDFHACFEAYLGNRWYLFDPTRLVDRDRIIRIGTGRDAADVAFATLFGACQMEQMNLSIEPIASDGSSPSDSQNRAITIADRGKGET